MKSGGIGQVKKIAASTAILVAVVAITKWMIDRKYPI
jgi:hypothetical protein